MTAFLTHLATKRRISASTQNQALSALLFLYKNVLARELGDLDAVRAKKPRRLPVVLSRGEVLQLLENMEGTPKLVAVFSTAPALDFRKPSVSGSRTSTSPSTRSPFAPAKATRTA